MSTPLSAQVIYMGCEIQSIKNFPRQGSPQPISGNHLASVKSQHFKQCRTHRSKSDWFLTKYDCPGIGCDQDVIDRDIVLTLLRLGCNLFYHVAKVIQFVEFSSGGQPRLPPYDPLSQETSS